MQYLVPSVIGISMYNLVAVYGLSQGENTMFCHISIYVVKLSRAGIVLWMEKTTDNKIF